VVVERLAKERVVYKGTYKADDDIRSFLHIPIDLSPSQNFGLACHLIIQAAQKAKQKIAAGGKFVDVFTVCTHLIVTVSHDSHNRINVITQDSLSEHPSL
jgi:hypothetical protein